MGYSSDIYIKADIKLMFAFGELLDTLKSTHNIDLRVRAKIYKDDDYIYCTIDNYEFYSLYPEIQLIRTFVIDNEEYCGMIAIREDSYTEKWGNTWDVDLSISMHIEGMN